MLRIFVTMLLKNLRCLSWHFLQVLQKVKAVQETLHLCIVNFTTMPRILHREFRFRIIDKCLRDTSRLYKINDIFEACNDAMLSVYGVGISKRSVQYDLSILRNPPYSIELDEQCLKQGVYRYAYGSVQPPLSLVDDLPLKDVSSSDYDICILRFSRSRLHEVENSILALCDNVEVLAPTWFRGRVAARISNLSQMYMVENVSLDKNNK